MAGESNALKFALFCEENGWAVEKVIEGKGATKRVIATSDDGAIVTAEWFNNAAVGPAIGHYTPAGGGTAQPIKNAASAKRIIDGSAVPAPPKPRSAPRAQRRTKAEKIEAGEDVITSNLKFDPYEISDVELLEVVEGRKITWLNVGGYETGHVPPAVRMKKRKDGSFVEVTSKTNITMSRSEDSLGERILNFCDPEFGYRALFVGALVRIG